MWKEFVLRRNILFYKIFNASIKEMLSKDIILNLTKRNQGQDFEIWTLYDYFQMYFLDALASPELVMRVADRNG